MSDGPHKSLPMKPRWKRVAERASKPAYTAEQVHEAVDVALREDWRAEVSKAFRSALDIAVDAEGSLFADQAKRNVEELGRKFASPLQSAIIGEVVGALEMGLRDRLALEAGVAGALAQRGYRAARQIEEHLVRETGRAVPGLRDRLQGAVSQDRIRDAAKDLLSGSRRRARPSRQDGIEDGPALP